MIKLTVDRCSRGNPKMVASRVFCEIIEVWFWLLLVPFSGASRYFTLSSWLCVRGWSLLLNWVILCEVESFSATIISWIHSRGPVCCDHAYLLRLVCFFTSSSLILVRHVFCEVTFTVDFLAN